MSEIKDIYMSLSGCNFTKHNLKKNKLQKR